MEKFLFYGESTSSMTCIPARRLSEIQRADLTTLYVNHELPSNNTVGSNSEYSITLTINSGKEKEIMKRMSKTINSSKNSFIVIADDINKEYVDSEITAIGASIPAIS